MQNTPDVNREDVLRVAAREFPHGTDEVLRLLDKETCPLIGANRLHLAYLKIADGSMEALLQGLGIPDSRDVVSQAEYPRYGRIGWSKISKMTESEVEAIIAEDWGQYSDWLNAE